MVIINAHIKTMEGPEVECGFVEIRNKKIAQVGDMSDYSGADAEILDACGGVLLPGLIDAHTHLGLWEDALGFEGDDGNEDTDPFTPHLRAIDGINAMDVCFREAREAGVTTVLVSPGSANPIGGQICALKTAGLCVDRMLLRAPAAIKFALGENPKTVYHEKNQQPVTRMGTAAVIRDALFKAREYADNIQKAEDPDTDEPDFDIKLDSLLPLIRREIPAHFHAHRADDIFTAVRIAEEFDLKYVIVHGTEAHLIADAIPRGVPVIVGPSFGFRSKPELKNKSCKTAGILSKAGILTAITTDSPETPIDALLFCAALCVRDGMEESQALRAITIDAARIMGLSHRIGSIKAGKDADMVLLSGDPFDLRTRVRAVFIDGERVLAHDS